MDRSDAEIVEVLESMGVPWHQHFVISPGLVGYYDSNGQLFAHVIEDDETNMVACKFLEKNGKVQKIE